MEKNFKATLMLNWKTGEIRVLKKKKKAGPTEIAVDLDLKLVMPETPKVVAKGEIVMTDTEVKEIVVERLKS